VKLPFNRFSLSLAGLLLVHLLFFLSVQINPPAPLSDSEDYLNASRNVYSTGVLYAGDLSESIVEEQFTRRPPFYPIFLGVGVLTRSTIPVLLIQFLVSIFSIVWIYKIFISDREITGNGSSGSSASTLLFISLLLATPAQFIYANRIMAEIPFQLLLVLLVWSVYHIFKEPEQPGEKSRLTNRYIWLFHLFLTLGMATKPVLYPFAIFSVLISLGLFLRTKQWAYLWAVMLPILWISIYSYRNYARTGLAQYSSIQTANMVNYNLRYFIMGTEGSETAAAEVDNLYDVCGNRITYREKNKCLGEGVKEIILERPAAYAVFHLKGSVRYFLDPGRFDLVTFFNIRQADSPGFLRTLNQEGLSGAFRLLKAQGWGLVLILGGIVLFKLLKISGFIIYLIKGKEMIPFRIFLALLVGYLALVTGPLGASRFLLPVELILIGGAVKGWTPLLLSRKSHR